MAYLPRHVDEELRQLFAGLPAVELTGPRGVGKTTTAKRFAQTVVRLDVETEAAAFRADPDEALRSVPKPVLLDEWQEVPSILGAIKRSVDEDFGPGQFLLTGSVWAKLDVVSWPGTGRVVPLDMGPLTQSEIQGQATDRCFLDVLSDHGPEALRIVPTPPRLSDYLQMTLAGGLPQAALALNEKARKKWLSGYLSQLFTRDVARLGERRDPAALRRYFHAIALNTAGVPSDKTIYEAAGVNRATAEAYELLFQNLLVIDKLPAWHSNRLKRLTKAPKRYVVDTGLVASLVGLNLQSLIRHGDLLGRMIDTFVVAQLRAQLPICSSEPQLFHLRQEAGTHEIDVIVEFSDGRVAALEIKADAAPDSSSAKHLAWLRDQLGERFISGVVLHTGPRRYKLGERIFAVPICALWGAHGGSTGSPS